MNRDDAELIKSALRACRAAANQDLPEHVKNITLELAIFVDCLAGIEEPACIDLCRQELRKFTDQVPQ